MIAPTLEADLLVKPTTVRQKRLVSLLSLYGRVRANQVLSLEGFPIKFETKDFREVGQFIKANNPVLIDTSRGSTWEVTVRGAIVPGKKENPNDVVGYTKQGKPMTVRNVIHGIEFFRLKALEKKGEKARQYWAKHYQLKGKLHAYRQRNQGRSGSLRGDSRGGEGENEGSLSPVDSASGADRAGPEAE